ncbi:MAG: DUF951 domain-containing protein [Erysipelotrichales bacterium]|nr:DUF951 domain-containing protein [Erysipelotrichales bacterium]
MEYIKISVGDIVEMKKEHPCAKRSKLFEVVRVGADVKLKCQACGNIVMLDREVFNKKIKKIVSSEN